MRDRKNAAGFARHTLSENIRNGCFSDSKSGRIYLRARNDRYYAYLWFFPAAGYTLVVDESSAILPAPFLV
jgi:hypothetical protein